MTHARHSDQIGQVENEDLSLTIVLLWTVVIFFYGAGDLFTTTIGVLASGPSEGGPIMGVVIEHLGVFGMVPLKMAVLGLAYVGWRYLPDPGSIAVPAGFAITGVIVTVWNAHVLLTVTL